MDRPFIRLLQIETKKAITNKYFTITFLIALIFALFSALYMIGFYNDNLYLSDLKGGNMQLHNNSLYNHWLGGESRSFGFTLFFTLLPLIATFPYGWSYYLETKKGYVKSVVIRSGKQSYFSAKYIATFLAGGIVIFLPLLFNFLIIAAFVPATMPTNIANIHTLAYPVANTSMWSSLFYTQPLLFVFLYLILNFVFGGLFATMSLALSFFVKNRIAVLLVPFFIVMMLHYSQGYFPNPFLIEFSPLYYLHALEIINDTNGWVVLAQGLLLFAITITITMKLGVKREVL